ncbi:unnamed protein product, partial [Nesidiocoris tenuis]
MEDSLNDRADPPLPPPVDTACRSRKPWREVHSPASRSAISSQSEQRATLCPWVFGSPS